MTVTAPIGPGDRAGRRGRGPRARRSPLGSKLAVLLLLAALLLFALLFGIVRGVS